MKKTRRIKAVLASALVALALACPAVVFSIGSNPIVGELRFEGAELKAREKDGEISYQAIFAVYVDRVSNTSGVSFFLDYNSDYLRPSSMESNQELSVGSGTDFFEYNHGLYYVQDAAGLNEPTAIDPFMEKVGGVVTGSRLSLDLKLDQNSPGHQSVFSATGGPSGTVLANGDVIGGEIGLLENVGLNEETTLYVMNLRQEVDDPDDPHPVLLGYLSFRVVPEHMAEMIHYFDGVAATRDYQESAASREAPYAAIESLDGSAAGTTFLLDVPQKMVDDDPWTISYVAFEDTGRGYLKNNSATLQPMTAQESGATVSVADSYKFDFDGKVVVDVAATAPEVTVNAYQNYTNNDTGDLLLTMGRYSPTVTVTYADGSKENLPFPWGENGCAITQEYDSGGTGPITEYDPTHGVYYFTQDYIQADGTVFPKKVTAKLTVTPITVIDVTAEDMERNYKITDVVSQVPDVSSLGLPEEARIMTDIVPSGVTLTVPIKAWKPVQPASAVAAGSTVSAWPTSATAMHSLKADDYVLPGTYADGDPLKETEGYPYWPETSDEATIASDPSSHAKFLGGYTFETAKANHTEQENILSADIQERYPWLTIPYVAGSTTEKVKDWDVGKAHRTILSEDDYAKVTANQYSAEYVSTVTETVGNGETTPDGRANGVGQPTLTLAVYKRTGTYFNGYGAMDPDSVFRIWLPNGQELGTGQVAGGVTVEHWFDDSASAGVEVNGYYDGSQTDVRSGASDGGLYFYLITNPDDPNQGNEDSAQRETLRRYINLGGWFQVSVCEDPGAGDHWCEPIPVYVPPRRNEYTEDKIYNFLGENAALCDWPGGIGETLYLPHGTYDMVGPLDTGAGSYTAGVGLPLYLADGSTTPTDGTQNPGDILVSANRFRLKDGVTRYRESYGVKTIYDGQTGAQPGEIFNVRVKDLTPDSWNDPIGTRNGTTDARVGGRDVYQYGPTPLYEGIDQDNDGAIDGYAVAGFGRVFQPAATAATPSPTEYTATLRREDGVNVDPAESVRIKLLSWDVDGITRTGSDFDNDNVTLVTYDAKQVGYTVRQDITLTIKNVGTTDIYGLDIDTVTDGYDLNDDGVDGTRMMGGHFEMLVPPASFLPVGATTTFTLTYVYDLPANESPNTLLYRDTLYITANGHDDPGYAGGVKKKHDTGQMDDAYLLDFDAEFMVSKDPLHKVTVIYRPTSGNMGTASLVVGEQNVGGTATMIYTPTTRTYPEGGLVYVAAELIDEYAIYAVHSEIDGNYEANLLRDNTYGPTVFGASVAADTGFSGTAVTDPKKPVYVFQMPNDDVTVYVDFYEPFSSKLRLENLIDFSSPPSSGDGTVVNDLKTSLTAADPCADHTYQVWRKTFTDAERAAAEAWADASASGTDNPDYYLMTQGRAMPHSSQWPAVADAEDEGRKFVSSENQYLVVIDQEDDLSQIEAKIRRIVYHEDYRGVDDDHPYGYNYEIELNVEMDVYPYNAEKQDSGGNYNWNTPAYQPTEIYRPENSGNADATDNSLGGGLGYGYDPAFTGKPTGNGTAYNTGDPPPEDGTSDSSTHISTQFASPAPGESSYVVITLTAENPENSNAPETRRYYVEIHRKTAEPEVVLHYGNSPYGMIMNEARFDDATKQSAAKAAFRNAGYTFEGVRRELAPDPVLDHEDMQHVTYNREAWVKNRMVFEPESLTGFVPAWNDTDNTQLFSDDAKTKPVYNANKAVYDENLNLDLNDYAYFAILGEDLREPGVVSAKDSSGRTVDLNAITAAVMDLEWDEKNNSTKGVTLLDTSQSKQVARFQGDTADFPVIDLGVQGRTLTFLAEHQPAAPAAPLTVTGDNWPVSSQEVTTIPDGQTEPVTTTEYTLIENIRPGRYTLVYTFTDFDGSPLRVTRPCVLLRSVGDVNSDGVRDNIKSPVTGSSEEKTDEYNIETRIGVDPLGYEAGGKITATDTYGAVYPCANIFKFRVCDVNNDRNINHIDANQVDKNVRQGSGWLRFYHPTDYGL